MLEIYKSSAGSGKTFTLVKVYIKLALSGENINAYKNILAITFTNKAANEMKQRIVAAFADLSKNKAKDLSAILVDETGLDAETILLKSQKILAHILHDYSDFSVYTIDAFVNKVIKSFTFDLKIPSNYQIEMDTDKVIRESVYHLLQQVNDKPDNRIAQILIQYLKSNFDESGRTKIHTSLIAVSAILFKENLIQKFNSIEQNDWNTFLNDLAKLKKIKHNFEEAIAEKASLLLGFMGADGVSLDDYYFKDRGIVGYLNRLVALDFSKLELNTNVKKTIEEDKFTSSKDKAIISTIDAKKYKIKTDFLAIFDFLEKEKINYFSATTILSNFYPFVILNELQKSIQQYKIDNNCILISDFHQLIYQMIAEQEIPIIYERLGEKYSSILIDEFQDTSEMQWKNLLPLVVNSQENIGNSMIVGDAKQAVYRFRGGDASQFVLLPKIKNANDDEVLQVRENVLMNYGVEQKQLNTNYRSVAAIVSFNNDFYSSIPPLLDENISLVYNDVAQECFKKNEAGFVSAQFFEKDVFKEAYIEEIVKIISDAKAKNFEYKDIAILVQRKLKGAEIATALLERNIPVLSDESLFLSQSPAVQKIISVLYYISNPSNKIRKGELLELLNSLSLSNDIARFIELINIDFFSFENYVSAQLGVVFSSSELKQFSLLELVSWIAKSFKIENQFDSFLQFFMDEVLQFSIKDGNDILQFLYWWEEKKNKLSIVYPATINAVKIMTIHKSKGLQFPIVILPELSRTKNHNNDYLWCDEKNMLGLSNQFWALKSTKTLESTIFLPEYTVETQQELMDKINVFYVATTRAEKALFILASLSKKDEKIVDNSIEKLLYDFANAKMTLAADNCFTIGNEMPVCIENKKDSMDAYTYQKVDNTSFFHLQLKKSAPIDFSKSDNSKILYGEVLHAILCKIKTENDIANVINQFQYPAEFSKLEIEGIYQKITSIIQLPELNSYFQPNLKIYNERIILDRQQQRKIPDRIVQLSDESVVIIDYKTGVARNEHEIQINEYGKLLTEMGFVVSKKILVYTNANTIKYII